MTHSLEEEVEDVKKSEASDLCGLMIDEQKEVFCGREAVTDIVVSNIFGKFLVPLCAGCSAKHRDFYSKRRRSHSPGRRNRARVYPRNGE